jgi:hypothetical protein
MLTYDPNDDVSSLELCSQNSNKFLTLAKASAISAKVFEIDTRRLDVSISSSSVGL